MDILQTIVEEKRREIAALEPIQPAHWERARQSAGPRRPFLSALQEPRRGSVALIAEVKKASPSAGVICPDFDPIRIARDYEAAGASCLSVLTDVKFFQGALEYLRRIRAQVALPLLRKDFIIDERQIVESLEWGADALLSYRLNSERRAD
jgi:indole-3-glycerol phosphate synthase